jgi:hypothetical protein
MKKIFSKLVDAVQYLSEGVIRLFSPRTDKYPEVGVQPFEGDVYSKTVE